MSSSSPNTTSRSPSPLTPQTTHSLAPVAIQSDDTDPWYLSMHADRQSSPHWNNPSLFGASHKEEEQMLRLDDLLEQHAYDDTPSPESTSNSSPGYLSTPPLHSIPSPQPDHVVPSFRPTTLLVPSLHGPISHTKPIPPPAAMPRKTDPAMMNQKTVHPPRDSCFNLPIMFPSIPEGGTKSRVETQVRVTVDLADASSSSNPFKYSKVGSWKWLKLPPGTATKRRTRKQGKIDPEIEDILHLSAYVTCATAPHNRVLSCSSCQAREAKRVAKKLAARVRPARSDSDSGAEGDPANQTSKSKHHEDTTSIIQFNCAEVLDFSSGSAVLPLRITCYCRHHREKVGFNVHFTMADHTGRIVGVGTSRPIMITDDHKTAMSNNKQLELYPNGFTPTEQDWSQIAGMLPEMPPAANSRAPSKRKKELSNGVGKKRSKPYDSSSKPQKISREGSVSSGAPSPSIPPSPLPASRSSTPFSGLQNFIVSSEASTPSTSLPPPPPLQPPMSGSETSSPDMLMTPLNENADIVMPEALPQPQLSSNALAMNSSSMMIPTQQHTMPFMFFDSTGTPQTAMPMQLPTIHRLIPNLGPTHGGIEVTVLGANFYSSLQLNCIFGDVVASSTQRWSDNTLVCVLPPRATAGVVAVWFDGFPKVEDQINSPPSLFTYMDESDRALMELALQLVGLKMTGKIEDAKNVAMRIVGTAGSDNPSNQGGSSNGMMMQQLASSPSIREIRPLLLRRPNEGEIENFEELIVKFLTILDTPMDDEAPNMILTEEALAHTSASGHTILHLASFLGFSSLVKFLVVRGADLDARDRNGFTPLHFAALVQSTACAEVLVRAGADREIVNVLGKTAEEIAKEGFFNRIIPMNSDVDSDSDSSDDEEAEWGDAEADDDLSIRRVASRRTSHRSLRRVTGRGTPRRSQQVSRSSTPPPAIMSEKEEKKIEAVSVDKQAASFLEMIQRTIAQFPAPQGIIPNMPQLPLPQFPQLPKHLPNLPDLPTWGALPHLPMVFPVFVPMMPGWPSLFGGEAVDDNKAATGGDSASGVGAHAVRTAQEWRATWEKWVALAVAATARQQEQTEDMPPPVYTPRAAEDESSQIPGTIGVPGSSMISVRPIAEVRPVGYGTPVPETEIDAFAYQPTTKQTQKLQKKHDRMLLLFWLPILLLSLLWALHHGVRFVFTAMKTALPLKNGLRL